MLKEDRTCRSYFDAALAEFGMRCGHDFYVGLIVGHAEKISIGACMAAVFRPEPEWLPAVETKVVLTARVYGLAYDVITTNRGTELWLFERRVASLVNRLNHIEEDSPIWHFFRGWLLGVPRNEIDLEFHTRKEGRECKMAGR